MFARETIRILHPSDEFDEKNVCFDWFDTCVTCALGRVCLLFFLVVPMTVDRLRLFALGAVIFFCFVLIFKKGVFKYVCARKQSVGIIVYFFFSFVKKVPFSRPK